jgi:hypothetical protein
VRDKEPEAEGFCPWTDVQRLSHRAEATVRRGDLNNLMVVVPREDGRMMYAIWFTYAKHELRRESQDRMNIVLTSTGQERG